MFAEKLRHHETLRDSRNEVAYYEACLEYQNVYQKIYELDIDVPESYYGTCTREKDLEFRVAGFPDGISCKGSTVTYSTVFYSHVCVLVGSGPTQDSV
jgi:hypothetical protein